MKKNVLIITLVAYSFAMVAQETTAKMSGFVKEGANTLDHKVDLQFIHTPTGDKFSTSSNSKGFYSIQNMTSGGPYQVKITCVSCNEEVLKDIYLNPGENSQNFNIEMVSKQIKEINITSRRKKVDAIAINIDASRMRVLPTVSRNITDMTRLTPQSANNSFFGTNFRYNNVTIDRSIYHFIQKSLTA